MTLSAAGTLYDATRRTCFVFFILSRARLKRLETRHAHVRSERIYDPRRRRRRRHQILRAAKTRVAR